MVVKSVPYFLSCCEDQKRVNSHTYDVELLSFLQAPLGPIGSVLLGECIELAPTLDDVELSYEGVSDEETERHAR